MQDVNLKLTILQDILVKKKSLLSQVLSITDNQEQILQHSDGNPEIKQMFSEMNIEKQNLIDNIMAADTLFQNMFGEISDELSNSTTDFRPRILALQALIREVMDLDIKIRVREQRNKDIVSKTYTKPKINVPKASKAYMLEQYKQQNKKNSE